MEKFDLKIILSNFETGEEVSEYFDGQSFYDVVPCQVSDKLGLTKMPIEYLANTRETFNLRRNRRLTDDERRQVMQRDDLDDDIKEILKIIEVNNVVDYVVYENSKSVDDVRNLFKGLTFGNLEDINAWFEDVYDDRDGIIYDRLIFKKERKA